MDSGVFGIPETSVTDERGAVMAKFVGSVGPDTPEQVIAKVTAGQTCSESNDGGYQPGRDDG